MEETVAVSFIVSLNKIERRKKNRSTTFSSALSFY